jgi:spermidine synthase
MSNPQVGATPPRRAGCGPSNCTWAIFLISAVGLFLEMMLIRWVDTEIRIFAYLQNTVLIVCFLGLGMGCFTCRKPVSARDILVPWLLLTAIFAIPIVRFQFANISEMLSVFGDAGIWYEGITDSPANTIYAIISGLARSFCLMMLLWEIFLPLGQLLGRLLDDHSSPIGAYSVNVAGGLLGIGLFALVSAFSLPPVLWVLVAGLMLWPFLGRGRQRLVHIGLLAAIVVGTWMASIDRAAEQVVWSPYQKLALYHPDDRDPASAGEYLINVNNVGYQVMIDLGPDKLAHNDRIPPELRGLSQYDLPLLFQPRAENVLIVGSGSGNDVAGALRGGARHVTAVEIDPVILEMGREHHPERPYQSERVTVVNDDARSFFATTTAKYDLVIFGLLDSHTTTSMTNARLDHYVYTRESLSHARALLTEGGIMVLSFEARKPYIADRMSRSLEEVFGHAPLAFRVPVSAAGWGGVLFVAGDPTALDKILASNPRLQQQIVAWQTSDPLALPHTTAVTTDDWPYLYLESPRIPVLYFLLAVLMLVLLGYARLRLKSGGLGAGRWQALHWHFFFLGAAFMLLEVQNISKASVVLGNTWQVNAVIVSAILCMVLLANLIVSLCPRLPQWPIAVALIVTCLALYFLDLSRLAFFPYPVKAVLVGALTTLPILFSGIIFIHSFAKVERKDLALGANLIGALVGGLLQSVTFVTGIKSLLLIVAGLYLLAMLLRLAALSAARQRQLAVAEQSAGHQAMHGFEMSRKGYTPTASPRPL